MTIIEGGCVLLSRRILENKLWYKPPEYLKIFIYILNKVNYKDGYYKTGEALFNFSEEKIYGVTKTQVYEFLRWAKSPNIEILTTQKTTRGVIVKLNNYGYYQNLENYKNQDTLQNTPKTRPKHAQHYKKKNKKGISNTHTNDDVCVELTKEEKEILLNYAIKSNARHPHAYIHTLIKNGGYKEILENAPKQKKEKTTYKPYVLSEKERAESKIAMERAAAMIKKKRLKEVRNVNV